MEERILLLERQLRRLHFCSALVIVGATFAFAAFRSRSADVITTHGIVILDDAGKERILIGAPIPAASNRVRTDSIRVRQIWGKRFSPQYATWYKEYRHSMAGMLILDENGFDRLAVGDSVPDPNIGKRIGPSTGIVINDQEGFERSGYGLLRVGNTNRVVLGLDSDQGTEALSLAVVDGLRSGIHIESGEHKIFLGSGSAAARLADDSVAFNGLVIREGKEIKHIVNAAAARK